MKCNKTKKITSINEKTMIVAVDIGKHVHHGYFRAPNGEDIEPFHVFNFIKGFHKFWVEICHFRKQHGLEDVVIGLESTGPYAEPLFHYLRKKPVKLV